MDFKIFTLHPAIFSSFFENSLIARGIKNQIISYQLINWREEFGLGSYKQVDDRAYGGGSGMVLMIDPIFEALKKYKSLGYLIEQTCINKTPQNHELFREDYNIELIYNHLNVTNFGDIFVDSYNTIPHNKQFVDFKKVFPKKRNVTVNLTPKGYTFNQDIAYYLANNFDSVSLLCGRYEGFDSRVSKIVDLELSLGEFITNGGETPAMVMIESIARLTEGFITKTSSVEHDSFSRHNNNYLEQEEFIIGKRKLNSKKSNFEIELEEKDLFIEQKYIEDIMPKIEHPIFTKPQSWRGLNVPDILLSGDHKAIHEWRNNWY
jgi:tRNA (guanine37-N1)-methyltransferase